MKNVIFTCLLSLFMITNNIPTQAQDIRVYFNQSVDNTVSNFVDAQTSSHLDDTVCAFINTAVSTLDIAVWDNGSTKIIQALNDAYNRGVQVRYISSSNSSNDALTSLNSSISVLERNSGLTSDVMHNKFIVVDEAQVLTGSMNFGLGSMFDDYNNIVIISDVALAQTYTTEFEEMWGATGAVPNPGNSKFGPDKLDNTTHNFTIGGSLVESYFSPTDQTTSHIVNAIDNATQSIDIAVLTFINNDLGDAVIAAHNRGVEVRCIIENVLYFGSEYNGLQNAGIDVISHQFVSNDFHHKYCIVDANGSDPLVITGSHNWTNSAEDEYDENTLIIHDFMVAQQYLEEFTKRWTDLGGPVSIKETSSLEHMSIIPNPNSGSFQITSNLSGKLYILNNLNQVVYQNLSFSSEEELKLALPAGIYWLRLDAENKMIFKKIIVQ